MTRSINKELILPVLSGVIAVSGLAAGYIYHNPLIPVLAILPAAVYEITYVNELTTGWAKWGLFIIINLEGLLILKNISIDVAHYLAKVTNLPVMDLRLVLPILITYFSYILARKTQGLYTRVVALVIMICSMGILYIAEFSLFPKII